MNLSLQKIRREKSFKYKSIVNFRNSIQRIRDSEPLLSAILRKQLESEAAFSGIRHDRTPSPGTQFVAFIVYIRKGNGGEEGALVAGTQDGIREDV